MQSHKKENRPWFANLLGGLTAGAIEVPIFYIPEVISHRLQVNTKALYQPGMKLATFSKNLSNAIFDQNNPSKNIRDLWLGICPALGYKILQRGYKFAGQPMVKTQLEMYFGQHYQSCFGERNAKLMLEGTAGMIIGAGEAPLLLPLDTIKIRYQTNQASLKEETFFSILRKEKMKLYNGLSWTVSRNAIGSMGLFCTSAAVKEYVFEPLTDKNVSYTFSQKFFASSVASIMSVIISNPPDVVKTRIQSKKGEWKNKSGMTIARDIVKVEGVRGFFKGTGTKIVTAGPKVAVAMTIAETASEYIADKMTPKK